MSLYQDMLDARENYKNAYIDLHNSILAFFEVDNNELEEEELFKVTFDEYDTIIVRGLVEIESETIERFCEEFDAKFLYNKEEILVNHQNVIDIDAHIFEYGFMFNVNGVKNG